MPPEAELELVHIQEVGGTLEIVERLLRKGAELFWMVQGIQRRKTEPLKQQPD